MHNDPIRERLLSPCCWAALRLSPRETAAGGAVLWSGAWKCAACGRAYPHVLGVACLSVLDADWMSALGESVARRKIVQRRLDGIRPDAAALERHEDQIASASGLMDALFKAILADMRIQPGTIVLDVGAGLGPTSAEFARRGARVVAAETELTDLFHISFEQTHPSNPESLDLCGERFYLYHPERYPKLFTRVTAPAQRLPFLNATFDIVFCRSALHHFQDLARGMREMLRVLKPGGILAACSEPARGKFDDEEQCLAQTVDKQHGFNERAPALSDYLRAMRGLADDVTVRFWPNPPRYAGGRLFRRIPYNFHRHLTPGEAARGIRLAKLAPFSGSVNITARRTLLAPPRPPRSRDIAPNLSIADLAGIAAPCSLRESFDNFSANTARLEAGLRAITARCAPPASAFVPALLRQCQLRSGWGETARENSGATFRRAHPFAIAPVRRAPDARMVEISAAIAPPNDSPEMKPCNGRLLLNGIEAGRFCVNGSDWRRLTFDIPDGCGEPIIDVEIGHDAPEGLPIRWIRTI
ncbi:MAG: class I SAM-dependent methyltransferase [Candidatus Sumerlaeota bacterium]|nr:class I SAM-dependent methyltransferase [Candidatus Sumerlaeota bacterium]